MPEQPSHALAQLRDVLIEAFTVNDALNQLILQRLDPHAWNAKPPGRGTRTIAAIFTHVHNIRRKWLRLSAPHLKLPKEISRTNCTQKQARAALAESGKLCSKMLAEALSGPNSRVKKFVRDGWARPWSPGASMVAYMLTHEAHHRGQVCMLAHQLGFPLRGKAAYGLWMWEKLWKECGFTRPR